MGSANARKSINIRERRSGALRVERSILMVRRRYRIRFSKKGNLRFIGHHDLLRAIERILRRARLPVAMSQGFHPKPRVSYLSALPLGFSSDDESMELILDEDLPASETLARLNAASVDGLEFLTVITLEEDDPKQRPHSFVYDAEIPAALLETTRERLRAFMASTARPFEKPNGKVVDARPPVARAAIDGARLTFELLAQTGPEVGARDIFACLELDGELFRSIFPNRKRSIVEGE